jgi:hypothetical protein
MKKLIAISSAIMAISFLMVPVAFAAPCTAQQIADGTCPIVTGRIVSMATLMAFLSQVTSWMLAALMIMALIFIIMGGYSYISSKGEAAAVTKAKNYIIYALIGVAIGALAKGLILAVCGIMGTECPIFF